MNSEVELKEFGDVYSDLQKTISDSLLTYIRGKGRTLEMLKRLRPEDVAVFQNKGAARNAFALAVSHKLKVSESQFIIVTPNRVELQRYVVGKDLSKKRHYFDHCWLELYWRSVIEEGCDVLASRTYEGGLK